MGDNALYDPIQVEKIHLNDFSKTNNIDLTHNESVKRNRFVWDREKQTLLSPSRPTNGFWSKHLSNMMQQDFTLEEPLITNN